MKFDEKLKQKYLYSKGLNFIKIIYFFIQKLKSFIKVKKSYSSSSQDLIISHFFRNIKNGIYIDVGCYHPYIGNNTKLLYDKGWSGINIDLDFHTIDFFNYARRRDENIEIAISDSEEEKNLYFHHNRSAINSLDNIWANKAKEVRKIKTLKLDTVIQNSRFKDNKINLLCIDVEGHELEVIKSFDLLKYKPDMIILEFIDKDMQEVEFSNQNIEKILNLDIYKLLKEKNYHFVNWLGFDLVFVHNNKRSNLTNL